VLRRASERWRQVRFSEVEQRQLQRYIKAPERRSQAEQRLAQSTEKHTAAARTQTAIYRQIGSLLHKPGGGGGMADIFGEYKC